MSVGEYLASLLLIGLVVRQIHGKRLTRVQLLWPLAIVGLAARRYLRGFPAGGSDVTLLVICVAAGLALGLGSGLYTRVAAGPDGVPIAKARGTAAALWIAGVGSRMAFALAAAHGLGPAIGRFSATHGIALQAWASALELMALAEVVARTALLTWRAWEATQASRGRSRPQGPSARPGSAIMAADGS